MELLLSLPFLLQNPMRLFPNPQWILAKAPLLPLQSVRPIFSQLTSLPSIQPSIMTFFKIQFPHTKPRTGTNTLQHMEHTSSMKLLWAEGLPKKSTMTSNQYKRFNLSILIFKLQLKQGLPNTSKIPILTGKNTLKKLHSLRNTQKQ